MDDKRADKTAENTEKPRSKWPKGSLLIGLFLLAAVIYIAMHLGEAREFLKLGGTLIRGG